MVGGGLTESGAAALVLALPNVDQIATQSLISRASPDRELSGTINYDRYRVQRQLVYQLLANLHFDFVQSIRPSLRRFDRENKSQ